MEIRFEDIYAGKKKKGYTAEIIHGVLMEIFGVGVLVLGGSGIGKSETALELLARGHFLVADDAVAVRKEGELLIGCATPITRHLMEIRGIGLIDVKAMYGAGAIKIEQQIDVVVQLEPYDEDKDYMAEEFWTYQEVEVPLLTLPVMHGRNISVLLEAAARNFKLKAMGYNAMEELRERMARDKSV